MYRTLNLIAEPADDVYRSIIDAALRFCAEALLVTRPSVNLTETAKAFIDSLKPFLRNVEETDEWPGTKLIGQAALVHRFALQTEVADALKAARNRLFDWVQPNYPEDLCFLRTNGDPWLITIAHERDGYFLLTDKESEELQRAIPEISEYVNSVI